MLARSRKQFLLRFYSKTDINLSEVQKKKERSLSYFDVIFAGILGGDRMQQKKIDLISCKISLLVPLEITHGPHAACET